MPAGWAAGGTAYLISSSLRFVNLRIIGDHILS